MKVYLKYYVTKCQLKHGECFIDWVDAYQYCWEENDCKAICEDYKQVKRDDDVVGDIDCRYCDNREIVVCKEAKSIEIEKDWQTGYVKIGRKEYNLVDVSLLKVDYGDGWVVEWDDKEAQDDD